MEKQREAAESRHAERIGERAAEESRERLEKNAEGGQGRGMLGELLYRIVHHFQHMRREDLHLISLRFVLLFLLTVALLFVLVLVRNEVVFLLRTLPKKKKKKSQVKVLCKSLDKLIKPSFSSSQ